MALPAWRTDPAGRRFNGYTDEMIWARDLATGGTIAVDQFNDRPDEVLIEVHSLLGDQMLAPVPVADAVAMARAILARFAPGEG
jgi:hypothetical protein